MFRFSVRDLLWLTLVVAVALGWFVRERQFKAGVAAWETRWEMMESYVKQVDLANKIVRDMLEKMERQESLPPER